MENSGAGKRPDALIAFACAAALIALTAWLGRLDLLDPDEGRHAEIAREMMAAGRWLTPVLNGEPYYDKPAAFYWLLGGSMSAFGEEAWAARLPSVLAALWTILVTARFARRNYGVRAGALTALGLATTVGFVAIGRTVLVDMCFTAALTTALCSLGSWYVRPKQAPHNILLFYLSIGIACLLKGPAAAAIGALAAAGTLIAARAPRSWRELQPLKGALIVAAVALPWYAAAWHADPHYIREFVVRHNVQRYLRPISTGHDEPWYYYLIALPAALLPWTPVVAVGAYNRLRNGSRTMADVFCAIWAGSVLVLFLPAGTKLLTYLLPSFPPLVMLGATWVSDGEARANGWIAPYALAWTSAIALAAPAAGAFAAMHGEHSLPRLVLCVLPTAALVLAVRNRRAASSLSLFAAVAGSALALTLVVFALVSGTVNELRGTRRAAALIRTATEATKGEFVAYRCTPNAIAFYARRPALRTGDAQVALEHFFGNRGAVLLMEHKRLAELGLDSPPSGVRIAWHNVSGLVLVLHDREPRDDGGEGRESNPPPTLKAGVTVLKTGRTTGPDPSPYVPRAN
jgi:4-amino-4-deoxy-L-arabinose transferase-like glycosyltransferase